MSYWNHGQWNMDPRMMHMPPGMMYMPPGLMYMPPGILNMPQPTPEGMNMPQGLAQKDTKLKSKGPAQTHTDNIPTKNITAQNNPIQNPLALVHKQPKHKVGLPKCYCDECKKGFTSKIGYNIHKNHRKMIYRCKCEFCGNRKGYTTRVYLMEHRSTHTNVDYFKCKKCGATFRFYQDDRAHRKLCQ